MNKTSVPFLAERFRKIAKDEAAKFFFFLESLRSNCIVLIVDGDKINHKMLKISPDKIAKPLLIIFNESSQQSKYPSNWKSAIFISMVKKGDTSLPSN
jgi:hypothetical protein